MAIATLGQDDALGLATHRGLGDGFAKFKPGWLVVATGLAGIGYYIYQKNKKLTFWSGALFTLAATNVVGVLAFPDK